jgi:hypothetical protein
MHGDGFVLSRDLAELAAELTRKPWYVVHPNPSPLCRS